MIGIEASVGWPISTDKPTKFLTPFPIFSNKSAGLIPTIYLLRIDPESYAPKTIIP
jgi:hypothetical protein